MASQNAQAVAKDVIETIGKHRKVSLRKIIKNRGYSQHTADNPKLVTETQTYKKETKPFLKRLEGMRDKILNAMEVKDVTKEQFEVLSRSLERTTHDIQLLSGGATEQINVKPIYGGLSRYNSDTQNISVEEKN